jgi:hypothetical protein
MDHGLNTVCIIQMQFQNWNSEMETRKNDIRVRSAYA